MPFNDRKLQIAQEVIAVSAYLRMMYMLHNLSASTPQLRHTVETRSSEGKEQWNSAEALTIARAPAGVKNVGTLLMSCRCSRLFEVDWSWFAGSTSFRI